MRTAVGDLDAGGVRAGLGGGDAAALGDRLLGVEVDRVDDVPLLDGAPQVAAAAAVHPRAVRRRHQNRSCHVAQNQRGTEVLCGSEGSGRESDRREGKEGAAPASPAAAGPSFF